LESSWSQILVQAALAAGSADRTDAAAEILTVIRTATHHEASALLAWDPVSGAHSPLAAFDYEAHTVVALGDRYASSPEHQSLQRSHAPTRISDLPAYRTSRTFLEVIQPAEFDDGMTMAIAGSDGGYRGMVHLSATSPGTFSVEASELISILAPVLARVCDLTRVVSLRPELPAGVRAAVMDQAGRSWPVDAVESSPLSGQPSFIGVIQRFLGSPTVRSRGTWPNRGGGWVFVELLRVTHPVTSGAVAVLVEVQDFELPYDLSPREFDILHGVARGHTNQRIASTRAISLRTVTTHIERILHKMNQESRAGAIGVALKEGFLRIDD
jgi:DNA-binding CsgD family transcriptional regulator